MTTPRSERGLPDVGEIEDPQQREMAMMFVRGLSDGTIPPTIVADWYLPPDPPSPEAPQADIVAYVQRRGRMFAATPSIICEYLAAVQQAIDAWDYQRMGLVFLEAMVFIDKVEQHLVPSAIAAAQGETIASLFRLDESLAAAQGIDLARLREGRHRIGGMMDRVLGDVVLLATPAWREGVPLEAAKEAPREVKGPAGGPRGMDAFRDEVQRRAEALSRQIRDHAREDVAIRPLYSDLDRRMRKRLIPGKPLAHEAIPDHHIFAEFLAHRYAYDADLLLYQEGLRRNGYDPARSHAFETREGLTFYIVMPSEKRIGELPPWVVFRGTRVDDLNDIRTDLEFQIGDTHFEAVRELGLGEMLAGAARDAGGMKPKVTGHSLGGALAQLTATAWPERLAEVVTFQAPGLTRFHFREAEERFAARPAPDVIHYIGDADVVHEAGQRHLPGRTVLVTGLHVDRGEGSTWGMGHSALLLANHRMCSRLVRLGLAGMWQPHTLAGYAELPTHPTTLGSGYELARGGLSLYLEFWKETVLGSKRPTALLRRARDLVAKGLDQDSPSLRWGAVEVTKTVAGSAIRAATRTARTVRWDD